MADRGFGRATEPDVADSETNEGCKFGLLELSTESLARRNPGPTGQNKSMIPTRGPC